MKETDLERRVKRLLPQLHYYEEEGSPGDTYRMAYFPRMTVKEAKKFGLEGELKECYGYSGKVKVFSFGSWNGKKISWKQNGDILISGFCFHDHKPTYPKLTSRDWAVCRDHYKQELLSFSEELKRTNPDFLKLTELETQKVKSMLKPKELESVRQFYEEKLEQDPGYKQFKALKKDVYDLETYVKYLEKTERSTERDDFKKRLTQLKDEYDSDKMKEKIPDDQTRLAMRGVMRKALKGQEM